MHSFFFQIGIYEDNMSYFLYLMTENLIISIKKKFKKTKFYKSIEINSEIITLIETGFQKFTHYKVVSIE